MTTKTKVRTKAESKNKLRYLINTQGVLLSPVRYHLLTCTTIYRRLYATANGYDVAHRWEKAFEAAPDGAWVCVELEGDDVVIVVLCDDLKPTDRQRLIDAAELRLPRVETTRDRVQKQLIEAKAYGVPCLEGWKHAEIVYEFDRELEDDLIECRWWRYNDGPCYGRYHRETVADMLERFGTR